MGLGLRWSMLASQSSYSVIQHCDLIRWGRMWHTNFESVQRPKPPLFPSRGPNAISITKCILSSIVQCKRWDSEITQAAFIRGRFQATRLSTIPPPSHPTLPIAQPSHNPATPSSHPPYCPAIPQSLHPVISPSLLPSHPTIHPPYHPVIPSSLLPGHPTILSSLTYAIPLSRRLDNPLFR